MFSSSDRSEIVFFDVETTFVPGQGRVILEFGAIRVCPWKLVELDHYSTLIRPLDLSLISTLLDRNNGINKDKVTSSPTFSEIADKVYDILQGRIWAGHNILGFDCLRIRDAFEEINRPPPEPKDTIDTWPLLTQRFGKRAGNMKMATLADYFGLGDQTHRSLDDVRMNLEVLKYCATVLFLESSFPDMFWVSPNGSADFIDPDEVSIPSINVSLTRFYHGTQTIHIMHKDMTLQLCCSHLKVRFGISAKFVDYAGSPRLNFVVDATPNLCEVLDACDSLAQRLSEDSGSSSEWRPLVTRNAGFSPIVRLNIRTVTDGSVTKWVTEIHGKEFSTSPQKLVFSGLDIVELEALFTPGTYVDAYFSLEPYDYKQNAGIRLVAKKLIIHSN
ncbi:Protein NEN3 [Camellia lanceoleosa]|uniref:Protein NEN3 n=1 Tax=Camellia lanceoleosa TaxID=1840588 RepID=A0ACC0HYI3_9ERIC|nr:Protein NEN3 [Camellia lanceoleosa]